MTATNRRPVPIRVMMAAVAILAVPPGFVLILLVAAGKLALGWGLLALVTCSLVTSLLIRPHLADLAELGLWARRLAQGEAAETPRPTHGILTEELASSVAQVRRQWQSKQAELATAARWHETLFDSLPDPLLLLAEGRRVVRMNQAAHRAFNRDIVGRDVAVALRDPAVLEATDEVLAGAAAREAEFTLPVPISRTFSVHVERMGDGGIDGVCAILTLHDLTAVRRIERMRADFVANASHELRTPLTSLLGFIETLRGPARDDPEARERFLSIMFDQGSRMARLVGDLLSLSRIELNEHSPPSDPVSLASIVEAAAQTMHPLAEAKRMTIVVKIDPTAVMVLGQADELAQLAQNLLDNAVKYGRDGTSVEIELKIPARLPVSAAHLIKDRAMVLSVTDHGDGIAREHLPRLTERFYRVDTARSRKLGGTGLGLAIVKHIVNRHRGTLTVESVVGSGSTFSVYLPLAKI